MIKIKRKKTVDFLNKAAKYTNYMFAQVCGVGYENNIAHCKRNNKKRNKKWKY